MCLVEFDLAGSEGLDGMKLVNIKPQVGPFVFPVCLSLPKRARWDSGKFALSCTRCGAQRLYLGAHEIGVKVEGPFKGPHYR